MKASREKYLETAEFLGAKLSRDAIWAGQRCNWFGFEVVDPRSGVPVVAHRMCGPDYFAGTSGVAVFLGELYAATGEKVFRSTAEGAIRQALSRLDHFPKGQRLTFHSGVIGIAHALLEVARTCDIEKFSAMALLILEEISCDELNCDDPDSTPGTILALLKIYRDHPNDFLLQTALRLGATLLDLDEEVGGRRYKWPPTSYVSLTLLELFIATGEEEYQQAAEQAFLLQRQHLSVVIDHGVEAEKPHNVTADGMSRLRAYEVFGDHYLDNAQAALQSSTNSLANSLSDSETDFSLARGLSGQADLLLEADRILHDVNYRLSAEMIGAFGIDRFRKDNLPWPCGENVEAPGLMLGLAGIGYEYLRLYDPIKFPSLLLISS